MFVFLYFIAVLLFLLIFYNLKKYIEIIKSLKDVPGPTPLPFIGNVHQLGRTPYEYLKNVFKMWQIYGPRPFQGSVLNRNIVFLSDVKDVETFLTNQIQLKRFFPYDLIRPFVGDGLATTSGEKWHKHRKMITPSFHLSTLISFCDVMNKNANNFVKFLKEKSRTGEIFDAQSFVYNCALDIICETAMGVNFDAVNNPKSDFLTAYHESSLLVQHRLFSFTLISEFIYMLTPAYWKQRKALKIFKTFIYEIIHKRHKFLKEKNKNNDHPILFDNNDGIPKKRPMFLDNLLTATIDGRPLTFTEIYDEVATFVVGGHDTTACALTFAIYCLAKHADIQEMVFQEQKLIFTDDFKKDGTYQEMLEMKYLELVIKETLRLFPSIPIVGRQLTEPYNLNGIVLPPGTNIAILLYAMGYNEKYFPDPSKFIPERFENNSNPPGCFPFSFGPRICIGQKFGMLEMKCVLSKIVRNFKILPAVNGLPPFKGYNEAINSTNEYDSRFSGVILAHSENGLNIRLCER